MPSAASEATTQAIWATVARIPAGCVASYGQVAFWAGLPGRARLVGKALGGAPSHVPWYRVLNAAGRISLPAGSAGAEEQLRRLQAEGVVFMRGRVSLARQGWRVANDSPLLD